MIEKNDSWEIAHGKIEKFKIEVINSIFPNSNPNRVTSRFF